jgi:transcriptional regulator with XRE-family HTH domain
VDSSISFFRGLLSTSFGVKKKLMNAQSPIAIGSRLRLLRKAKGLKTQLQLAKLIGADISRYNNWETGFRPVPVPFAIKICGFTGATLDYIYRGETSGLPLSLATALAAVEAEPEASQDLSL